ncbi:MAG: cytochrome C biogenesis protein [Bdellovibrionaceae bacterium]|nr:cytochrome C biogenesis protein [Pseudobdellovibrionaceae bacterium]
MRKRNLKKRSFLMNKLFFVLLSIFLLNFSSKANADEFSALGKLAVQDGGRIKPFDTFAKESMQLIHGKSNLNGRDAVEVVFTWMLLPDVWSKMEFLKIDYRKLKEDLDLEPTKKYFSMAEIMSHPKLPAIIQTMNNKAEAKERLNSYDQAIQILNNQLSLYQAISNNLHPGWIPSEDAENDKWKHLAQFSEEQAKDFGKVTRAFVAIIQAKQNNLKEIPSKALDLAVDSFFNKYQNVKESSQLGIEIHYNKLHPFQWAWILYLLATIFFFLSSLLSKEALYKTGLVLILAAFAMHIYGFSLRVLLTGRPPVSNMYETVVWVPFGTVLFALFFEWKKRSQFMLLGASLTGAFCMLLADFAPNVLDPSLQPLEPVLRSNLWLTVHVLTITISYGAFFLAFTLGDLALFYIIKGEKKYKDKIKDLSGAIYRAEKIGVVLLAAGTILGGVWADYSWGRFWGWDPKETWALIALLGYLALLHAKQGGHIKQVGMIAGSVVSFSLVIMAWYGVNYVLGAGLHSYGFGAGGLEYVASFVGIHIIFVIFVLFGRKKEG